MPTLPLNDDISYKSGAPGRFWTARMKSYEGNSPETNPSAESPASKKSEHKEPAAETCEPYVETFDPPRKYDPTADSKDDALAATMRDLQNSEPTNLFNLPQHPETVVQAAEHCQRAGVKQTHQPLARRLQVNRISKITRVGIDVKSMVTSRRRKQNDQL